jgi:hypothetical protein
MNLYDVRGYYIRNREEVDEEGVPIGGYVNGIFVGPQGRRFGEGLHNPVYYLQDSEEYHSTLVSLQDLGLD